MAIHEQSIGKTDEWYTPPHVFDALGCEFSVDVASPGAAITPWIPARRFVKAQSLERDWRDWGFIWMNPPFGKRMGIVPWLEKFFAHGNGVALDRRLFGAALLGFGILLGLSGLGWWWSWLL